MTPGRGSARPVSAHVMTGAFNLLSEEWPLRRTLEPPQQQARISEDSVGRHRALASKASHLSGLLSLRAITAPAPAEERRRVLEKSAGLVVPERRRRSPLSMPSRFLRNERAISKLAPRFLFKYIVSPSD